MKIRYAPLVWAKIQTLTANQQGQVNRLIRAVILANTNVGRPWNYDLQGRQQWVVSASDTQVIYRIVFARIENTLYVTNVLVFDTPEDPNNV